MFIDMHCHSVSSDDSRATVEQYLKWVQILKSRGYQIDALVLTEHRKFELEKNYRDISNDYGVIVLKGAELDTTAGHFLVYGVNEYLLEAIDFTDVELDPSSLVDASREFGAIAIPAHPGRFGVGLCEYDGKNLDINRIDIVELLNGGDRGDESARANKFVEDHGYYGIGGSDAHLTSSLGKCLTEFYVDISSEVDLVNALHTGLFRAVRLEDTNINNS